MGWRFPSRLVGLFQPETALGADYREIGIVARRPLSAPDSARRRFVIAQFGLAAAFAISMSAAATLIPRFDQPVHRWLFALVPVLLLTVWAWRFFEMIRADDEMMQALHLRAVAISAGLVLLAVSFCGIFERLVGVSAVPAFLQLPAFALIYGIAMAYLKDRA